MAVTDSPRLGLTRWSAGTDPLTRLQLDGDHAALDAAVAMFVRDTLAARPAAGVVGRIFEVTGDATADNNGRLFWDTGAAWREVALLDMPGAKDARTFKGEVTVRSNTPSLRLEDTDVLNPDDAWRLTTGNENLFIDLFDATAGTFTAYLALIRNGRIESRFVHRLVDGTAAAPGLAFINDPDTGIYRLTTNVIGFATNGLSQLLLGSDTLRPDNDNVLFLGKSTHRWREVWAVNGTIQTSDVRVKEDVQPIPEDTATERVRRVGKEAAISYRWPDGTRRHVGFDAEQVGVIHGETSAAYIDPTYEADARSNPYTGEPTAEWYADHVDEDDDPQEQAEQRAEAQREWVEAREAFDRETAEIRDAPKGLRPSEMVPDLYAALAKALDRIDQLESRVAALESA